MLKYTGQKPARYWLILLIMLFPVCALAENPQVLRLLVWEGYAPQAQREQFIQYINDKYAVNLTLKVNYMWMFTSNDRQIWASWQWSKSSKLTFNLVIWYLVIWCAYQVWRNPPCIWWTALMFLYFVIMYSNKNLKKSTFY